MNKPALDRTYWFFFSGLTLPQTSSPSRPFMSWKDEGTHSGMRWALCVDGAAGFSFLSFLLVVPPPNPSCEASHFQSPGGEAGLFGLCSGSKDMHVAGMTPCNSFNRNAILGFGIFFPQLLSFFLGLHYWAPLKTGPISHDFFFPSSSRRVVSLTFLLFLRCFRPDCPSVLAEFPPARSLCSL